LLLLEHELGRVIEMLETASTTPPKVRTGGRYAVRRRRRDRFDHAPAVPSARLGHLHAQVVTGKSAADEHDVAMHAAHALPTARRWHRLTLRPPHLTTRLRAQFAATTSRRFVLTPVAQDAASVSPSTERRRRALAPEEKRDIDAAVAAIGDEALRDSARRLLTTARRSLVVVTLAALAAGCAAQGPVAAVNGDEPPRRTRFVAPSETSDAYYHYSAAQMMAQNGRFREAIAAMEQAIKRDPESAFLWRE